MRKHQNGHEVPDDLFELDMQKAVAKWMFDKVLKRGIAKRLEQSHFSGGSLHLAPPEDLVVIQVDDCLVFVKSYSHVEIFLKFLHGSENIG